MPVRFVIFFDHIYLSWLGEINIVITEEKISIVAQQIFINQW